VWLRWHRGRVACSQSSGSVSQPLICQLSGTTADQDRNAGRRRGRRRTATTPPTSHGRQHAGWGQCDLCLRWGRLPGQADGQRRQHHLCLGPAGRGGGLGTVVGDGSAENVFGPAGLQERVTNSTAQAQYAQGDGLGSVRRAWSQRCLPAIHSASTWWRGWRVQATRHRSCSTVM
jgi:hypothetical protein